MVNRKKKLWEYIFFTAVWSGVQITCGSEFGHALWKVLINIHLCKLARFSLPLLLFDARPNFLFAAWLASHSCAKRLEAKWSLISMRSCFQSIQRGCFRVKSSFECWSVLFAVCFRFFKLSSNFQLKLDRKIVNGKVICVLTTLPVHAG